MRIRWRGLELPNLFVRDDSTASNTYTKFIVEPFERGYGHTIGNSLRRILLSSLEGAAITGVRIKGIAHEFSSIEGVVEDVTSIILNIKKIVLDIKSNNDVTQKLRLSSARRGPVHAGNIQSEPSVSVMNKNLVIATLTENIDFELEMEARRGRGYRTAVENITEDLEAGTIPIDSIFSPVTRVSYRSEDCRVGQKTNYDRLVLEVWTNGTITPEMAVAEAAQILRKHLNPFVQLAALGEIATGFDQRITVQNTQHPSSLSPDLEEKLSMTIQNLELSNRATNCLVNEKIDTVKLLISKTEDELLKIRSFGRTSLREVVRKLEGLGLKLGMSHEELAAISSNSTNM